VGLTATNPEFGNVLGKRMGGLTAGAGAKGGLREQQKRAVSQSQVETVDRLRQAHRTQTGDCVAGPLQLRRGLPRFAGQILVHYTGHWFRDKPRIISQQSPRRCWRFQVCRWVPTPPGCE
jgi:hypothetical protein